jgi:hypothetical protein
MKPIKTLALSIALSLAAPAALAAGFDGSRPMLCAPSDLFECDETGCQRVNADEIDAPRFLRVDVKNKLMSRTHPTGKEQESPIERVEELDGKLILQGAEDGLPNVPDGIGWSLAIQMDTGRLVLSGSGDDVAFTMFGACIIP